jgi:putative toxin-antitoxin system antitoxin component (TIGR02293 family)
MAARTTRQARAENPFIRVVNVLGAKFRIGSAIDLHEQILEGFPCSVAVNFVSTLNEIPVDESIRVLNISSRSWHRIKAEKADLGKSLDVDQSARLWSMAEILAKAEEVLGTRDDAEQWLSRPAMGLESRRPIDLMATPQGAVLVKTLLDQMEHGVYA